MIAAIRKCMYVRSYKCTKMGKCQVLRALQVKQVASIAPLQVHYYSKERN